MINASGDTLIIDNGADAAHAKAVDGLAGGGNALRVELDRALT